MKNIFSNAIIMYVVVAVVVLIGTIITVAFPLMQKDMRAHGNITAYKALELAGRDVYQSQGCMECHSQNVRPIKSDVDRYVKSRITGDISYKDSVSTLEESSYDHPFLWGSRRIGPDLSRVGLWHDSAQEISYILDDARAFYPSSNMPKYDFLRKQMVNKSQIERRMKALGYSYTQEEIEAIEGKTRMDAISAYLMTLGSDIKSHIVPESEESQETNASEVTAD